MALYLNQTKKNPKTGKNEKTGKLEKIGNVSRGSAGGYTKGVVDGLQQTSARSLSGPVYGAPDTAPFATNFQPIVPNSLPSPNLVSTPDPGLGALPNSPFVNGYNPNQPTADLSLSQAVPSPAAPAVPTSSTPPAGAQGALTPEQQQQAVNQYIQSGAYEASLREQGLQSGAAAEVTPGDVMVLQGFGSLAKSVTTTLAGFARDAALASTVGGAEVLAVQAAPAAASGVLKEGTKAAGKAAANTATAKSLIQAATATAERKLLSLGLILTLIKGSLSTSAEYKKESTAKIIEVTELMNKLQRSGDPVLMEQASQLRDQMGEAVNDVNKFRSYAPFGLLSGEVDKDFNDLSILLTKTNLEYDNFVKDQAARALLSRVSKPDASQSDIDAAKTYLATQEEGPLKTELRDALNAAQDVANVNAASAEERLQASQQAFQTSEREARQAYEQSVRDAAAAQKQFEQDTQTTTSEGGTLTFGLLGGGGATEFVSADRASQAYFGKVYAELTPAQKQLLNLLKGGN